MFVWKIQPNISSPSFHQPPFMIETITPQGKEFDEMKTVINAGNQPNFINWINVQLNKPEPEKGKCVLRLKRNLILICYYDYFSRDKPFPLLSNTLDQLAGLLDINESEKKMYTFFASGPIALGDSKDDLLYHFSKEIQANKNSDLTFCHLFVNILAMTLGLPRNSNPYYPRIFTPEILIKDYRGPGSTYPSLQQVFNYFFLSFFFFLNYKKKNELIIYKTPNNSKTILFCHTSLDNFYFYFNLIYFLIYFFFNYF